VWKIISVMDVNYPVCQLAKSKFQRATWKPPETTWAVRQGSISVSGVCELLWWSESFVTARNSANLLFSEYQSAFPRENGSRSVNLASQLQAGAQVYVHIHFYVPVLFHEIPTNTYEFTQLGNFVTCLNRLINELQSAQPAVRS
jgi:hypothetical protein